MSGPADDVTRMVDDAVVLLHRLRCALERRPGHRNAMAKGLVDGALAGVRQAREMLAAQSSSTWTKTDPPER